MVAAIYYLRGNLMFIIKCNNTRNYPAYVSYLVRVATPKVNTDNEFYANRDKAKAFATMEEANAVVAKLLDNAKRNGGRLQISPMYIVEAK